MRTIWTEIGPDLSAFPTEKHFASWLGPAPRHAVPGGKPLPAKQRGRGMGATRVSNALRMAATSLIRLVYRMMRWGQDYVDEGEAAYEDRH